MSTSTSQGTDPQQLISSISNTYSSIERGDWVNAGLGMANTAMGMVGMSGNPLSGFLAAGFSWATRPVAFLPDPSKRRQVGKAHGRTPSHLMDLRCRPPVEKKKNTPATTTQNKML
jgi:hypothetical protein